MRTRSCRPVHAAVAALLSVTLGAGGAVAVPGGALAAGAAAKVCSGTGLTGDVVFSVPSRTFTNLLSLSLRSCVKGAEVRYTLDGTLPVASSRRYSGPAVRITETTRLRAQSFADGVPIGRPGTALYIANTVATRHDLPVVVMDVFGAGKPGQKYLDTAVMTFEPRNGTATLADAPAIVSRAGVKVRGQSSSEFAKPGYRLELRGNDDKDAGAPFLGMPSDADWVFRGPYVDKSLIHDALTYDLGPDMGRLKAPRYRLCELYLNTDGGALEWYDYRGVYLVSETIEVSKNRLDISKMKKTDLTSPEIEGGYVFKFDDTVAEEPMLPCTGPEATCWKYLEVVEPDPLQPEQQRWLTDHVQRFHDVLYSDGFADPAAGYRAWIDVPSFIDYMIVNELSRNIDGYVRSAYFYKDRNGKIFAGPLWDYDLAWGVGGTGELDDVLNNIAVEGWHYEDVAQRGAANSWFYRLTQDPAFTAQLTARWRELRGGILSDAALTARVAALAAPIANAAVRNFDRWPNLTRAYVVNWNRTPATGTWPEQIQYTLDWAGQRAAWLDSQWGIQRDTKRRSVGTVTAFRSGHAPGERPRAGVSTRPGGPTGSGLSAAGPGLSAAGPGLSAGAGGRQSPTELIANGTFDEGPDGWWSYSTAPDSLAVDNGRLCAQVPGGTKFVWDAGIGQGDFPLVAGKTYKLSYQATASPRMMARAVVELAGEPYTGYYVDEPTLTETPRTFTDTFVASDSLDNAHVTFQFGADSIAHTVCLDNVSLTTG